MRSRRTASALGLGAAAVLLVAMRLHAFALPLETDEANYAVIGGRLLAGDRLYVDVWDHQPPGVFVLFAAVTAVFGNAPVVFRVLALAFSLGSLAVIWVILRRAAGPMVAVGGAVLFALVSADPGTAGEGCNREIFMATLILAAWASVLRRDRPRPGDVVLAGTLLGVASVLKTIVAVHWVVLALWLLWSRRLDAPADVPAGAPPGTTPGTPPGTTPGTTPATGRLKLVAALAAGPALIWLLVFGYFAATGRFGVFFDAVFRFNLAYSHADAPFVERFTQFFQPVRHPFLFHSAAALWWGGGVAFVALLMFKRLRADRVATAAWALLVADTVAICLPNQFWPHYYYLLIPALALVVPLFLGMGVEHSLAGSTARRKAVATATLMVGVTAWLGVTQWREYVSKEGLAITIKRYNTRDYWARAQGLNVRRVTDPGDTVFVFGNDAGIYYYSGRRCASRFTMATGLRPGYPGAERRQALLLDELSRRRPRLILETGAPAFPGWKRFLTSEYELVGVDLHDRTRKVIMPVWCLKDRPIERIDWDWDRAEADRE